MMPYLRIQLRSASIFIILILFSVSCKSLLPIKNQHGLSQNDYQYSVPDKIDDGWETASLIEANVNSAKIINLIKNILAGEYPNTHSVLLVKNGKLILEEYFYGYNRDDLHYLASATKRIFILPSGMEETELFPISETTFQGNLKDIGEIQVDFSKDGNGKIDYLTIRIGFSLLNFDKIK